MVTTPPSDTAINVACSHALSSKNFLIWRIIVATYFWTVLLWSQIDYNLDAEFFGKILIYLTIWTLIICTVYMTLSLYVSYMHFQNANNPMNSTENGYIRWCRYCKYTERVQILATTISVTVVLAFWSLLWQYADMKDPINIQVHGTTMVLTIIDFYLNYSQIQFKYTYYYVIIFGFIYIVWSIIYQLIADEAIYPVLDWKNQPVLAIIVGILTAISSLLIHLFLCWSNNKFISRYYKEASPFIALSETIHDDQVSKDKSVAVSGGGGANSSLSSGGGYGTRTKETILITTTND